ncbi:adenylate kinase [Enteropsectra breve]|nr:adenylate kinase [Enteropsectra breve]
MTEFYLWDPFNKYGQADSGLPPLFYFKRIEVFLRMAVKLNLIIMGLPGCGKGTQSARISEKYGIKHISSGDMLREEMESNGPYSDEIRELMESGKLFPDELLNKIFVKNVPVCNFLLDGYPRKLTQVETFKDISMVIFLTLSEDEAVQRILRRNEGREDDNEEAVKIRLKDFDSKTQPVIEYFTEKHLLKKIDASGSPDEVFAEICRAIDGYVAEQ